MESYRQGFLASEFIYSPCYLSTVPDLEQLVANDTQASPPDKYKIVAHVIDWSTNVGYPGYANAATSEIYDMGLISTMFAHAAIGKMTSDEALTQADQEVRKIFQKWQALGKV